VDHDAKFSSAGLEEDEKAVHFKRPWVKLCRNLIQNPRRSPLVERPKAHKSAPTKSVRPVCRVQCQLKSSLPCVKLRNGRFKEERARYDVLRKLIAQRTCQTRISKSKKHQMGKENSRMLNRNSQESQRVSCLPTLAL